MKDHVPYVLARPVTTRAMQMKKDKQHAPFLMLTQLVVRIFLRVFAMLVTPLQVVTVLYAQNVLQVVRRLQAMKDHVLYARTVHTQTWKD